MICYATMRNFFLITFAESRQPIDNIFYSLTYAVWKQITLFNDR